MVMELLVAYEQRGSGELRRALQPIREQLSSAGGRQSLGITVEDRSEGLD